MSLALTSSIDVAQVVLYAFYIFFFGLIYWLRMEDRREGYPLESDNPRRVSPVGQFLIPKPKRFLLPDGHTYDAPSFARDQREIAAERTAKAAGSPLEPTGNPLLSNVGPASWAERHDEVEKNRHGEDMVVPLRVAESFSLGAGPDPRGFDLVAGDGKVAGKVKEVWIDRADLLVRYLEVEVAGAGVRLVPMPLVKLDGETKRAKISAIHAHQLTDVPTTKEPDRITTLEEEKVSAYFAGGKLYADAKRLGPVL